MNTQHSLLGQRGRFVAGCAALMGLAGCADHRISVAELQQREWNAQAVPVDPDPGQMAQTAAMLDRQLGPYRISIGDVVQVEMRGLKEDTGFAPVSARVNRDGHVRLPQVGMVSIAGLELEDAESAVTMAYVPAVYRDSVAHVSLIEPATTKVVVTGAVPLPSMVELPRTQRNVLHALNLAGGLTSMASGRINLQRLNGPGSLVKMDLTNPEQLRQALAMDPLESGDILDVEPAMPNTVFVGGLVNAPRPQSFPNGVRMSVLQVLAASGGVRLDLFPREATLIRRQEDGTDVHVKLNLNRINRGEDPNILLAAGDVLWVPHTIETRIQEFINNNIFLRAGVTYTATGSEDYIHGDNFRPGGGGGLEEAFDPFGFLTRNSAIRSLGTTVAP